MGDRSRPWRSPAAVRWLVSRLRQGRSRSTRTIPIAKATRDMRLSLLPNDDPPVAVVPLTSARRPVGRPFPPFRRLRDPSTPRSAPCWTNLSPLDRARWSKLGCSRSSRQARAQAVRERSRVESQRRLSVRLSRTSTAEAAADIVLRRAIAVPHRWRAGCRWPMRTATWTSSLFGVSRAMTSPGCRGLPSRIEPHRARPSAQAKNASSLRPMRSVRAFPDGYRISGEEGRGVWSLPLIAQGVRIGALVLILDSDHLPSQDDRSAVRALAAQVAPALQRARASDQTKRAAEELQRAMLPAELPALPGAAVPGLYRSATQILEVGGDWYDAVETGDETIMVAVGDVVGRGVSAAATMGQLRVAWRALAIQSDSPGRRALRFGSVRGRSARCPGHDGCLRSTDGDDGTFAVRLRRSSPAVGPRPLGEPLGSCTKAVPSLSPSRKGTERREADVVIDAWRHHRGVLRWTRGASRRIPR